MIYGIGPSVRCVAAEYFSRKKEGGLEEKIAAYYTNQNEKGVLTD
jgi:hypothetical protein